MMLIVLLTLGESMGFGMPAHKGLKPRIRIPHLIPQLKSRG